MHIQTCTRPDISFTVGILRRYQSNLATYHRKVVKKVLRYLKGTKDYMFMYKRSNHLKVYGYSNSDFVGYDEAKKSMFGCLCQLAKWAIS